MDDSPQVEAIKENANKIAKLIKGNLITIANDLKHVKIKLLTDEDYDEIVSTPAIPPLQRANTLIQRVIPQVEVDPAQYEVFRGVLEKHLNPEVVRKILSKLNGDSIPEPVPSKPPSQQPPQATPLKPGDLKDLKILLRPVAAYWDALADQLEMIEVVEIIRNTPGNNTPPKCLRDLLNRWLNKKDGHPTVETLCQALRADEDIIGGDTVAKKLEEFQFQRGVPGMHPQPSISQQGSSLQTQLAGVSQELHPSPQPLQQVSESSGRHQQGREYSGTFTRSYWMLEDHAAWLTGKGTVIAILDSGINMKHTAFLCAANKELKILPAPKYSRNFNQGWGPEEKITDHHDDGHGTLCAGIAAGFDYRDAYSMSNQGYKPIQKFPGGVAPQAQLIVCRIDIDENQIVQALDHLIKIQEEGLKKVDVVSMSFGLEKFNQQIEDRIKTLTSKRTICVASAGNDGQKYLDPITYPATSENVICVGASDSYGNRAPFSPVGPQMEFLAPGESVLGPVTHTKECLGQSRRCTCGHSPNHTSQCAAIECSCGSAHTKALNCVTGTSYAAPAVAGLISLLIQFAKTRCKLDTLNTDTIRKILWEMSLKNHSSEQGYGPLYPHKYLKEWKENLARQFSLRLQ